MAGRVIHYGPQNTVGWLQQQAHDAIPDSPVVRISLRTDLPGEAEVTRSGHGISIRWDVASGNVANFFRNCQEMARTHWGPAAEYEVVLRPDGYADIVRTL